jgi:hypothetical protein
MLAVLLAVPLRGMADVRPAIARIVFMENRTAGAYQAALARFNAGTIRAVALAQMIDRTIVPDLQAARAGVEALRRVPREHQPLIALTEEYLRLRDESWRLRSDGLRHLRIRTLKEAERKEFEARELLMKVRDLERRVT